MRYKAREPAHQIPRKQSWTGGAEEQGGPKSKCGPGSLGEKTGSTAATTSFTFSVEVGSE